jgi:LPS export ABC transporter protein LptC
MHVVFFTDSGTVDTDISADYAKHLPEQRVIEAENNVIVKNSNGDILSTEQLTWDIGGKRIFSNAFVKITTGEEIIYGDGLESNQEFTKYQIKHIKGIISVDEENSTNEDVQ